MYFALLHSHLNYGFTSMEISFFAFKSFHIKSQDLLSNYVFYLYNIVSFLALKKISIHLLFFKNIQDIKNIN